MRFIHFIVNMPGANTIRVALTGNAAWVRVMDDSNFNGYRTGGQYQYYGGYYVNSPVIIRPPLGGKWNVVVDLNGGPGQVNATVQVI